MTEPHKHEIISCHFKLDNAIKEGPAIHVNEEGEFIILRPVRFIPIDTEGRVSIKNCIIEDYEPA
jgi:hypothetical protein